MKRIISISGTVFILFTIGLLLNGCDRYGDESDPNSKVWIPDDEFLERLTDAGIDTDGDGKISYAEAEKVTSLNVSAPTWSEEDKERIKTFRGIEAFVNLEYLDCSGRIYISYLHLSNITALTYLDCEANDLTSLDLLNNTALTYLNCSMNDLESLDLSSNTELEFLNCEANYDLDYIDISNCTSLRQLWIRFTGDLTVCVWDTVWSDSVDVRTLWLQGVNYTTECNQ